MNKITKDDGFLIKFEATLRFQKFINPSFYLISSLKSQSVRSKLSPIFLDNLPGKLYYIILLTRNR